MLSLKAALLLSLASSTLALEARVRLSKGSCSRSTPETTIPVDVCVPIADTAYKSGSLEISDPWPICSNGEDAKLAYYWPQGTRCEEAALNTLATKKESMNMCNILMMTGSLGFVCDGLKVVTPPKKEPARKPSKGGVIKYEKKGCSKKNKPAATYHAPDTCLSVNEGMGLEFTQPAVCKNGTAALIAGFKGDNCDPTSSPLKDPFTKWDDRVVGWCVPTDEIRSMTFWCDGLDGVDMTKPGGWKQAKKGNFVLILSLILGIGGGLLLLFAGLLLAYRINYHFRTWVNAKLGWEEGYIAL
ncbi:hypothetical protein F5884DRAFT_788850 [Xylogone sp. PMI_703]|nr:hypothetical protein F5884DRAFT_788850 [Xylogone sp. PMI_703]